MNTLHDLQHGFVETVFDDNDNDFSQFIIADGINGTRRLQIYHNNIYISLRNALSAVYPVVCRLVGDEFFNYMSSEYIKHNPSQSGNLHEFGKQLGYFIESFEPVKELAYLPDVARLEWAYHRVFHAMDSQNFDIEKLRRVKNEYYDKLVFMPNPASQLIFSPYPVLRIWQTNQDNRTSDTLPGQDTDTVSLDEGETRLLVIRRNLDIEFQTLTIAQYAFLQACFNKANFFEACDAAMHADPKCIVGQLLLELIQSNTLSSFTFQTEKS